MNPAQFLARVPRDVDHATGKVRRGPIAPPRDYAPRDATERQAAAELADRTAEVWPIPLTLVDA